MSAEYETIECATRTHQHPVGSCPHCTIATLLELAREYADACLDCGGSGTVQRYDTDDSDSAVTEFVDCTECSHVRAVIAAVEGA